MTRLCALMAFGLFVLAGPASAEGRCSLESGRATHSLEVAGTVRTYHVNVGPAAASLAEAPVVFLWHGFGGSGQSFSRTLEPARHWPEAITVAANGLPRTFPGMGRESAPGWQIQTGELGDRDLAFFDALVSDVSQRYCVDPDRIYSTGFSNGGYFSNLLGCVRGHRLAAIAPVSGGGPRAEGCDPIPVRIAHGTKDDVIPYGEARASWHKWAGYNGCEAASPPRDGCASATGCKAELTLCPNDGHHRLPRRGSYDTAEFFRRHRRGER